MSDDHVNIMTNNRDLMDQLLAFSSTFSTWWWSLSGYLFILVTFAPLEFTILHRHAGYQATAQSCREEKVIFGEWIRHLIGFCWIQIFMNSKSNSVSLSSNLNLSCEKADIEVCSLNTHSSPLLLNVFYMKSGRLELCWLDLRLKKQMFIGKGPIH